MDLRLRSFTLALIVGWAGLPAHAFKQRLVGRVRRLTAKTIYRRLQRLW
jgi:hypothetical protein